MSQPAGSDLRELAATEVVFPCVDRERVEQLVSDALGLPRRPAAADSGGRAVSPAPSQGEVTSPAKPRPDALQTAPSAASPAGSTAPAGDTLPPPVPCGAEKLVELQPDGMTEEDMLREALRRSAEQYDAPGSGFEQQMTEALAVSSAGEDAIFTEHLSAALAASKKEVALAAASTPDSRKRKWAPVAQRRRSARAAPSEGQQEVMVVVDEAGGTGHGAMPGQDLAGGGPSTAPPCTTVPQLTPSASGPGAGAAEAGRCNAVPIQYTCDAAGGWADPRRCSPVLLRIGGLELHFEGGDLFRDGDEPFDCRTADASVCPGAAYPFDDVLQQVVWQGRTFCCVKWHGYECAPTHHSAWIPASYIDTQSFRAMQRKYAFRAAECICCNPGCLGLWVSPAEGSGLARESAQPTGSIPAPTPRRCPSDEACSESDVVVDDSDESDYTPSEDGDNDEDEAGDGTSDVASGTEEEEEEAAEEEERPSSSRRQSKRPQGKKAVRRLDKKGERLADWRAAGLNVVDCPSRLPARKVTGPLEDGLPYILAEQVSCNAMKAALAYVEALRPFMPQWGHKDSPVLRFDYGDKGLSAAMRDRMHWTNIHGHLPPQTWVQRAKAGDLSYLEEPLVIRDVKDVIGWKGEEPLPRWFRELYPRGKLTCVLGKLFNSQISINQLRSRMQEQPCARDGDLAFPPEVTQKARARLKKHLLVPVYQPGGPMHGMPRPLTTEEAEELMGFPRGFVKRYHWEQSPTRSRGWLGDCFNVHSIAYLLHPLAEMQERGKLPPEGITVASFCSGIGGAEVALQLLGIKVKKIITAEVEDEKAKLLTAFLKHQMPQTQHIHTGDMTKDKSVVRLLANNSESLLEPNELVHLVVFGSPCKDVSAANSKAEGIHGKKSTPSGPPCVDRFASALNEMLPHHTAAWREPGCEAMDYLHLSDAQRGSGNNYCNPPWPLLPDLVQKLRQSGAAAAVVAVDMSKLKASHLKFVQQPCAKLRDRYI
eukprot:jgi/Tetstr1/438602/TSEL_027153.t1